MRRVNARCGDVEKDHEQLLSECPLRMIDVWFPGEPHVKHKHRGARRPGQDRARRGVYCFPSLRWINFPVGFVVRPYRSSEGENAKLRDMESGYKADLDMAASDRGLLQVEAGNLRSQVRFVLPQARPHQDYLLRPRFMYLLIAAMYGTIGTPLLHAEYGGGGSRKCCAGVVFEAVLRNGPDPRESNNVW